MILKQMANPRPVPTPTPTSPRPHLGIRLGSQSPASDASFEWLIECLRHAYTNGNYNQLSTVLRNAFARYRPMADDDLDDELVDDGITPSEDALFRFARPYHQAMIREE